MLFQVCEDRETLFTNNLEEFSLFFMRIEYTHLNILHGNQNDKEN